MKVAIIIPTKNRPEFIERTIRYYAKLNSHHVLYIGDASGKDVVARINMCIEEYKNIDIRYFNWINMGANQTIVQLAKEIGNEHEFCAFHGDDDYFVPDALSKCARFLAENPEYRTAQGRAALFTLDRRGPYGKIASIGDYWGINNFEQDSCVDRVRSMVEKYFVPQFSVHRTSEFLDDSKSYIDIKDDLLGELLHSFAFIASGKSKFVDCLQLIRNYHPGVYHPPFIDWVTKPHWSVDFNRAVEGLAVIVCEKEGLDLKTASDIASEELKRIIYEDMKRADNSHKTNFVSRLKKKIPQSIIKHVKKLVVHEADMRILATNNSIFHGEFIPVLESIGVQNEVT